MVTLVYLEWNWSRHLPMKYIHAYGGNWLPLEKERLPTFHQRNSGQRGRRPGCQKIGRGSEKPDKANDENRKQPNDRDYPAERACERRSERRRHSTYFVLFSRTSPTSKPASLISLVSLI